MRKKKISWVTTVNIAVKGWRLLYLVGTDGHKVVKHNWVEPGDKIRITVERVP